MIFLFGGSRQKCDYVLTRSLYDQERERNDMYRLRSKLSPSSDKVIATTFKTTYPFITDMVIDPKDKKHSDKLKAELFISSNQADELFLAKKMKCPLVITPNQLWLTKMAKKLGVKIHVFR